MNAAFHKKTEDDKNIFKEGEVNKAPTDYKEKKLSIEYPIFYNLKSTE